jgi:hypothetical protein
MSEETQAVKSDTVTETWTVTIDGTRITVEITHEDGLVRRARIGADCILSNKGIRALLEVINHYRVK